MASDAAALEIRPISADDRQAFVEAFERLGETSRYRRFLTPHGPLSDAEVSYFTDVDHHDHEAMVAVDAVTKAGVGVARYVRSTVDHAVAELAVAVVDDWQRRGVGTRLVAALAARARSEGIRSFSAMMLAENDLMLKLINDLGTVRDKRTESGTVELIVDLPDRGLGRLARLLRAAAKGEIRPQLRPRASEPADRSAQPADRSAQPADGSAQPADRGPEPESRG
ncbi:MAG: GNAT family N-acetyltransferase [Solirubrobacteraceae bacterium]